MEKNIENKIIIQRVLTSMIGKNHRKYGARRGVLIPFKI